MSRKKRQALVKVSRTGFGKWVKWPVNEIRCSLGGGGAGGITARALVFISARGKFYQIPDLLPE